MAGVPGVRFLPNAITVLALCSGLSSVALALNGLYFEAIAALAAGSILDSLDGPAARLLNSTSRIGAELDSLSDAISFGVAPALIIYAWKFRHGASIGWSVSLVFAVCVVLRLARFNSLLDDDTPRPYAKGFFTGVPAPAAGLLTMVPVLLWHKFGDGWWTNRWLVGGWVLIIAFLAISRLPSIALKSVRVAPTLIVPLLLLLVVGVVAEFYQPEVIFSIGLGVYLLHLPYAGWKYLHLKAHPELWDRTTRQGGRPRSGRRIRLTVRNPRAQRVAGRAADGSPLPLERRGGPSQLRGRLQGRRRLR